MMTRSVNCKLEPSRRELIGGLTVLTVLACVLVSRDGRPREALAGHDGTSSIISPAVMVDQTPARAKKPALVSTQSPTLQLANENASR